LEALTDSYKPKYIQLAEIIRHKIISGKYKEGDKLLSENELKREYSVSSTTVRKCIDILRNDGLIDRFQGVGTFVSERPIRRSLVLSFTKNMEQVGLKPSTDVLEKKIIRANGKYADRLKVNKGEDILRLRRLRYGDETPMMLEARYINLRYCHDIRNKDLTGSLYDVYQRDYGIELTKARQHLKIVYLKEREAKLLQCEVGAPAFMVTGVTYSSEDKAIEYEESLYRGDEYEFFVEVYFQSLIS